MDGGHAMFTMHFLKIRVYLQPFVVVLTGFYVCFAEKMFVLKSRRQLKKCRKRPTKATNGPSIDIDSPSFNQWFVCGDHQCAVQAKGEYQGNLSNCVAMSVNDGPSFVSQKVPVSPF